MATPYEKEYQIAATSGVYYPLDFPGRALINKVSAIQVGGGTPNMNFYSRLFDGTAEDVFRIENDGNTKCKIVTHSGVALRVGDEIDVAGTGVGGYNVTHTVTDITQINDPNAVGGVHTEIVTDIAYSADAQGGTLTLDVPTEQYPLYQVMAQQTVGAPAFLNPPVPYVNQDPLLNANIGFNRKIYVVFSTTGTFQLAISATLEVSD